MQCRCGCVEGWGGRLSRVPRSPSHSLITWSHTNPRLENLRPQLCSTFIFTLCFSHCFPFTLAPSLSIFFLLYSNLTPLSQLFTSSSRILPLPFFFFRHIFPLFFHTRFRSPFLLLPLLYPSDSLVGRNTGQDDVPQERTRQSGEVTARPASLAWPRSASAYHGCPWVALCVAGNERWRLACWGTFMLPGRVSLSFRVILGAGKSKRSKPHRRNY